METGSPVRLPQQGENEMRCGRIVTQGLAMLTLFGFLATSQAAETAKIEKKIPKFIAVNNFLVLILDKASKENLNRNSGSRAIIYFFLFLPVVFAICV